MPLNSGGVDSKMIHECESGSYRADEQWKYDIGEIVDEGVMEMAQESTRFFFPVILVILAYEWLVSGLDKLLSGTFVRDMHHEMMDAIPDMQYQFYAHFLQKYCMLHCEIIAAIVETGEILVGLSFLLLAFLSITGRLNGNMRKLGVITGLVSAFMNLNFFFYQGGSFFVNTSDPFDEGIPIDLIMLFIQVAVATYFLKLDKHSHGEGSSQQITV
jgi:thiosulfate dehydrogenase [quinone] large subunit